MSITPRNSQSWFSILVALWTIGVLLIIVVGLASVYIREMKLSRMTYNEIIAWFGAEGMFEYGMLKVRNHREWFSDMVTSTDIDASIMKLSSPRSSWMQATYSIKANATDAEFLVKSWEHLIIPLFSAQEDLIVASGNSKKPTLGAQSVKSKDLRVSWLANISWTIVAIDWTKAIGISWSGNIFPWSEWIIRHRETQCYNGNGELVDCANTTLVVEELPYFWDEKRTIENFLATSSVSDPYIMIYNNTPWDVPVRVQSSIPFSLPEMTIESVAKKNDSSQVYRFTEDKSHYYDALKYGVYNN